MNKMTGEQVLDIEDFMKDKSYEEFTDSSKLPDAFKYSFKYWWTIISAKYTKAFEDRIKIYEEALKNIPGSYKLWYNYLQEGIEWCEDKCILCPDYNTINKNFERSLIFMHKMPRIWLMYYEFLKKQKKVKKIRETLDKALQSLPVTQHEKIWEEYSKWALNDVTYIPLSKYILERYIKINPDFLEDYANYLKEKNQVDEYICRLIQIIDDDSFSSAYGKNKFEFCMEICEEITQKSDKIKSVDGEKIIRHCIKKYTDEVGNLWVYLADYFITKGLFDKGRDIFEEA